MWTIHGEISEGYLTKRVTIEPCPCGESITTSYYDPSGELVRQDVEVRVMKLDSLNGDTGKV